MLVISNHNSFRVLFGNTASVYIFALHGGVKCKILKRARVLTTPLSGKIFHRQGGTCYGKSMYKI